MQSVKIKLPSEGRLKLKIKMLKPQKLMAGVNRLSATIKLTRWNREREREIEMYDCGGVDR